MIMHSKKIFFLTCFIGLIMAEDPVQPTTAQNKNAGSWLGRLFTASLDTTQNKEDLKEVITFATDKATDLVRNASNALVLNKLLPQVVIDYIMDYINGSEAEKKRIIDNIMLEINGVVTSAGQAEEKYKVFDNIRARFYPSTLDFAYYGFVFGSAVFIGFNGLYYVQQKLRDYLAISKPKYISPLSKIGLFDRYKQKVKSFFYGLKKRANDAQVESVMSALSKNCINNNSDGKKQYGNCLVHFSNTTFLEGEAVRLLGNVANKLEIDFIAVPSINLLQKNTVIDISNELLHLIHKNNRPVLLYIDNVSLLSMDGTEYSEREECIRMIASFFKSSASILHAKCMIVAVMNDQALLEGPLKELFKKHITL